jgi:hypothetical protein
MQESGPAPSLKISHSELSAVPLLGGGASDIGRVGVSEGVAPREKKLSGRIIIDELIRNADLGQFDLAYSVLLPSVFTIYLHPAEHARLAGVFPLLSEEAVRALRAHVAELNKKSGGFRSRDKQSSKEYKIARHDWVVGFLPDAEVPEGDIEIHSELAETAEPGYRGVKTTLTGRDPSVTARRAAIEWPVSPARADRIYAEVRYEDDSGAQKYLITQNLTRVGRGGADQPMDLALYASDDVSREHLIIRRDPATGIFTAVDCSTNGTWLDGRRLRKSIEEMIPERAEIKISDAVTLSFERRQ